MEHVGLQFTIFKGYINVTGLFICKAYRTHSTHTANRPKSEAEAHLYRSYFLQNPYFSVRLLKLRPMTKMGFFISNYFINKISHGKNQFVEKSTFLELHICLHYKKYIPCLGINRGSSLFIGISYGADPKL